MKSALSLYTHVYTQRAYVNSACDCSFWVGLPAHCQLGHLLKAANHICYYFVPLATQFIHNASRLVLKVLSCHKIAHLLTRAAILSTSISTAHVQSHKKGRKSYDIIYILVWKFLTVNNFHIPSPWCSFTRSTQRSMAVYCTTVYLVQYLWTHK